MDSYSRVARAVILHNSHISRRAVVQNTILDKNVVVLEPTVSVMAGRARSPGRGGGIYAAGRCPLASSGRCL